MAEWHFKQGDEVVGPISGSELLARVRQGEIQPETLLRKGDSSWVPAEEVNGLFEAIGQKALEYHCPECHEVIHKPPTHCEYCGAYVQEAETQRFPVRPTATVSKGSGDRGSVPDTAGGGSWWRKLSDAWRRWTE
jgi:hypothetical protein